MYKVRLKNTKRLAVIPSNPLENYEKAGYSSWLQSYYNPMLYFDEVFLLSPKEKVERFEYGMYIIPTQPNQLQTRIKDLGISVVRAYGGYWPCDMACKNKVDEVPVVVSVHDTTTGLLHDSIKRADVVICMSRAVKKLVLTKYRNENKVWLLPNRVNFDVMRPYPRDTLSDLDNKYPFKYKILHVGRKSREKNLDTSIKALKFLGDEYCLLAIGRGRTDSYVALAQREGVLERCFFIESIKNVELPRYYSWADCMCTPSRWEGFGIVFIEALACEAVVVTSEIAPMNEYIDHMENGLLVREYENPYALAEMIKIACTDEQVRLILKTNARKSVEKFEQSRIDTLEVSYYKRILNMELNGDFVTHRWKQLWWSGNQSVKRLVPRYAKKRIRHLLSR